MNEFFEEEKMTKEKIIEILENCQSEASDEFDDWLCYEKYGEEKFLSKGFYPTKEDFEVKGKIDRSHLATAISEITKLENHYSILEELVKGSSFLSGLAEEILNILKKRKK